MALLVVGCFLAWRLCGSLQLVVVRVSAEQDCGAPGADMSEQDDVLMLLLCMMLGV